MELDKIINRINDGCRLLSAGTISEIDRDILLADIRSLYVAVKGYQPAGDAIISSEQDRIGTPLVSNLKDDQPYIAEDEVIEQSEPAETEISAPPVQQKEIAKAPAAGQMTAPRSDPHTHKSKSKSSSLNEGYQGGVRSLNERIGAPKKSMLNDVASRKDLKGMIDFNKQYILTNELFKGNSQAFQDAIARINDSPTLEAAFEYIKTDLLPVYQWNGEMQSARLFDKLVRQKFGV